MKREVFYPPVGIAHVTNKVTDLILYKLKKQTKIIINTSAQPNSSPHLGTITTIMCAFGLAEKIKEEFKIETEVQFDELENSPAEFFTYDNDIYYKDQCHSYINERTKEKDNMVGFLEVLNKISQMSKIHFTIRKYNDFQKNKYVRESVIKIVNSSDYFSKLLSPADNVLHIRTICPVCGLGKKNVNSLSEVHDDKGVGLKGYCPIHGKYNVIVRSNNSDYIDINTQLRDLTKGYAMIMEDKINNTLTIMLDGGDWSGMWAQRMHTEGLVELGINEFPIRYFAPVILDWSGAKFSKSMYLKNDAYKDINSAFINYNNFVKTYGENGIVLLWNEVKSWINDPKKFFRNYSVDYFQNIMEGSDV